MANKEMVVGIGQERSGTTMLIQIIDALGISMLGEEEDPKIASMLGRMSRDPNFDFTAYTPVNGHVGQEFIAYMKEMDGKKWSWKVPRFIFFWRDLVKHIPDAKFVVITRNPYATALSGQKFLKKQNNEHVDLEVMMDRVASRQAIVDDFIKNNECLVVQYEKLIMKPEEEIGGISDYIGGKVTDEVLKIPKIL